MSFLYVITCLVPFKFKCYNILVLNIQLRHAGIFQKQVILFPLPSTGTFSIWQKLDNINGRCSILLNVSSTTAFLVGPSFGGHRAMKSRIAQGVSDWYSASVRCTRAGTGIVCREVVGPSPRAPPRHLHHRRAGPLDRGVLRSTPGFAYPTRAAISRPTTQPAIDFQSKIYHGSPPSTSGVRTIRG